MDYKITLTKPWPYRHPTKGRSVLAPGTYAIPEDLPDIVGLRAIGEGIAERIEVEKISESVAVIATAPKRRGRPRKTPATQNKLANVAENKVGLV